MNNSSIFFVTGANRGLGLEFVRQLSGRGDIVIGGYRAESRAHELLAMVADHDSVFAMKVDSTIKSDLVALGDFIDERFGRLDVLINNAGVSIDAASPIADVSFEDLIENFRVNVGGPMLAAQVLHPLLVKGINPRIVNISSAMGSIELCDGGAVSYRVSKAALNMLSKLQSLTYSDDGIVTIALSPGWVVTDMGGPNATYQPHESIASMLEIIDKLRMKNNGEFLSHARKIIPY